MVDVIEGEALEQEFDADVLAEGGLNQKAAQMYAQSYFRRLETENRSGGLDRTAFVGLLPYARFKDLFEIVFEPMPKEEYLGLLETTSPDTHTVLTGSDLLQDFPDMVDVQPGLAQSPRPYFTGILNLEQESIMRTAERFSACTRKTLHISLAFVPCLMESGPYLLAYFLKSGQEFSLRRGFYATQRASQHLDIHEALPRSKEIFTTAGLKKYLETGITSVRDMIKEYQERFECLTKTGELDSKDRQKLSQDFKNRNPNLFYDAESN